MDAFPICVDTRDTGKIVELVELMAPTFGGVNLEDIKAPECFVSEDTLKKNGIFKGPIFHDDQHGTAVVTLAGLINALKIVGKKLGEVTVCHQRRWRCGYCIIKLLMAVGLKNVIMCDSKGAIWEGRPEGMNPYKDEIAKHTNPNKIKGGLAEAIKGADVFIGVSAPNSLNEDMIRSIIPKIIVFAQANPIPEIWPLQRAFDGGAKVVATGRSTAPTRSTTCWPSPVFSGAPLTCAPLTSTMP